MGYIFSCLRREAFSNPTKQILKKEKSMKNKNIVKNIDLNIKKSQKTITPEALQDFFLDAAQKECDSTLRSFRGKIVEDYADRLDAFDSDFFSLFDEFVQWRAEIKEGYILRILEYLGVYDGCKIDKDRLLTALRVICFIGYFSDDRNGTILSFKGGALMVPYDDVVRLERIVRTAV